MSRFVTFVKKLFESCMRSSFKCSPEVFEYVSGLAGEWMAVKDDHLYIGGLGKEWTTSEYRDTLNL